MPLIPEQVLEEIHSRSDIAELIGRYVPLKRAGRHFKALCPFHKERTPSFHINTDKQIFHCFGCGVGGNIFSFIMQHGRLTFPEAVRQLAQQVGVSIPQRTDSSSNGRTHELLGILEKACLYYERLLMHPRHGRAAREYLQRRGIRERTRKMFRLGCAPSGWDHLVQAATRTKISLGLLEQAGLILRGSRGLVDLFRERLMFPILDARGRVVGFGGRSLKGQEPKYLNSPQTSLYSKGRQLFGLFAAKEAIAKAKAAVVVEGYFDCVWLWQAGLEHVVSPLGTAFTPEQARLLARYTNQAILAFDADAAGETATLRGIDTLVEEGIHVHVTRLPSGIDPDELVRSAGTAAFRDILGKAMGVMDFLIDCAARRYNLHDPDEKVQAAQFVLPTIAKIPNAMLRAEYVRLLADRLHLNEKAVAEELSKVKSRSIQEISIVKQPTQAQGPERLLAALVLDQPSRWDSVKEVLRLEDVRDGRLRRILSIILEMRSNTRGAASPAQVISRLVDEEANSSSSARPNEAGGLVSELVELASSISAKEKALEECVRRLVYDARRRHLANLREQIREAQERGRSEELTSLLTRYQRMAKGLCTDSQGGSA